MAHAPLHVPAIRRLLLAYGINQLGDWAGEMALAVAVFAASGNSGAVAALWVAHRLALAWLAPWVVARLARHPRAAVLRGLYLVQAALSAALVVGLSHGLAIIVPLLAVDGLLAPAARALTRTALVAAAETGALLREANGLVNVVCTVNGLLAPVAGGLLVAAAGAHVVLVLDAVSCVVAAIAVRTLRTPVEHDRGAGQLRAAWRFARSRSIVGLLLAGDALWTVFISAITPIEVAFVCGTLGAGPASLGVVLAGWGAGMVAGGIAAARLRDTPLPLLLAVAAGAPAVACLGMGTAGAVGTVVFWSAVGGIGNGVYGLAFVTALQERTPAAHQACVNALYDTVGSVAPGLGFAAGGLVAATASPRAVYFVAGLGALAVLASSAAWLRRSDWAPLNYTSG